MNPNDTAKVHTHRHGQNVARARRGTRAGSQCAHLRHGQRPRSGQPDCPAQEPAAQASRGAHHRLVRARPRGCPDYRRREWLSRSSPPAWPNRRGRRIEPSPRVRLDERVHDVETASWLSMFQTSRTSARCANTRRWGASTAAQSAGPGIMRQVAQVSRSGRGWNRQVTASRETHFTACIPGRAHMCPFGHSNAHQSTRTPSARCSTKAREPLCASWQSGQWWLPVMNVAMHRL
jgi:hypothetical protein